jgi:hypothetical protein
VHLRVAAERCVALSADSHTVLGSAGGGAYTKMAPMAAQAFAPRGAVRFLLRYVRRRFVSHFVVLAAVGGPRVF